MEVLRLNAFLSSFTGRPQQKNSINLYECAIVECSQTWPEKPFRQAQNSLFLNSTDASIMESNMNRFWEELTSTSQGDGYSNRKDSLWSRLRNSVPLGYYCEDSWKSLGWERATLRPTSSHSSEVSWVGYPHIMRSNSPSTPTLQHHSSAWPAHVIQVYKEGFNASKALGNTASSYTSVSKDCLPYLPMPMFPSR